MKLTVPILALASLWTVTGCGPTPRANDVGAGHESVDADAGAGAAPADDGCTEKNRPAAESCGLNGRGELAFVCEDNEWVPDVCIDPDVCVDDEVALGAQCGPNNSGLESSTCVSGQWETDCAGADECQNGDFQASSFECGYDSYYLKECIDGEWTDTFKCDDAHVDDTALLEAELFYACDGDPLSRDEILRRMPGGSSFWLVFDPRIRETSRHCTSLNGCDDWDPYFFDRFILGFGVDQTGTLRFFQSKPNGDEYRSKVVSDGLLLNTIATNEITFADEKRMLVKMTDSCFAMSSLVEYSQLITGATKETLWGLKGDVSPSLPEQHDQNESPPESTSSTCPLTPTSISEIAQAWIPAGRTQAGIGGYFWDVSATRSCSDFTGCSAWRTNYNDGPSGLLFIVNGALEIELDHQRMTVRADGTFSNSELSGWVNGTCIHARKSAFEIDDYWSSYVEDAKVLDADR